MKKTKYDQKIKEIPVTVDGVTKEFLVAACQAGLDSDLSYKFSVKVKLGGIYKDMGFIRAKSFTKAAEDSFDKHSKESNSASLC